jgi:hypothetical protein
MDGRGEVMSTTFRCQCGATTRAWLRGYHPER